MWRLYNETYIRNINMKLSRIYFRIGNIAATNHYRNLYTGEIIDFSYIEIKQYYKNIYFGNEKQYIKVDKTTYSPKGFKNSFIDISCFKYPETSCTIGYIRINNNDEINFESIGEKPFELSEEDYNDYSIIMFEIHKLINKLKNR